MLIALTDKVKADVPLIVRRPPIISDNSTRSRWSWWSGDDGDEDDDGDGDNFRSVVALEGRRVELRCYASGYPPPGSYPVDL